MSEQIEQVLTDLKFLLHYEEMGTGLFDKIQMIKQMITTLEGVLNGKTK